MTTSIQIQSSNIIINSNNSTNSHSLRNRTTSSSATSTMSNSSSASYVSSVLSTSSAQTSPSSHKSHSKNVTHIEHSKNDSPPDLVMPQIVYPNGDCLVKRIDAKWVTFEIISKRSKRLKSKEKKEKEIRYRITLLIFEDLLDFEIIA